MKPHVLSLPFERPNGNRILNYIWYTFYMNIESPSYKVIRGALSKEYVDLVLEKIKENDLQNRTEALRLENDFIFTISEC